MSDTHAATTAATTTAETTTAATTGDPWHKGVDAETLGHWQNKGWKTEDPKEIALAATKQARELERHFGVPADQLLKLPKADAKPEDIAAFRQKLGWPVKAEDYDFTAIKDAAGQAIPQPLADTLRTSAHAAGLTKEAAAKVAADVVKHLDSERTAAATLAAGKLAEERTKLDKDWGPNKDFFLLKAMEGARRLGPEFVAALETAKDSPGYAAIMNAMRKIGMGTSEDTFIERGAIGGPGQGIGVTTREGAVARKAELMADKEWGKRYLAGGSLEAKEMNALNMMIDGESA